SNRRHLLPRDMMENERSTAINPGEAVEEKVSLSDRFGLWLGFHSCSQDEYLAMVKGYCGHFGIKLAEQELERAALEWATTLGRRRPRAFRSLCDGTGRARLRRASCAIQPVRRGVAAENKHDRHRVYDGHRSGRPGLCRKPGAPGWQHHRLQRFQLADGRQMAGDADTGRAARRTRGCSVQSRNRT